MMVICLSKDGMCAFEREGDDDGGFSHELFQACVE